MKKQFILAGMVAMSLSVSACGAKENKDVDNTGNTQVESQVGDNGNVGEENDIVDDEIKDINDIQASLESSRDAVSSAYENYIPNMPYDETAIKELFGIDSSWYDGVVAEGPMISAHVDTFIAIHPTEGNLENVETALINYKDYLVNESFQYPMNLDKVKAATVTVIGENVYFIMLGFIDDAIEDSEKRLEGFNAQNNIAVDAINEFIGK